MVAFLSARFQILLSNPDTGLPALQNGDRRIIWISLGTRPQRINPGHLEQNGRHERMHRSLKEYLRLPVTIVNGWCLYSVTGRL